ncbi:MAG: nucleotidyltransferase family protein [Bacteroidia bacterium]|nr:nucleotidyltransferase family protein [Bacteroidia bacterium]
MKRQEIILKIIEYLKHYYPIKIGLFGSFSRGEEKPDSDIDILVSFKNTLSLLQIIRIERELSEIVERKIDILTEPALKNQKLKEYINKDLKIIFE